MVTVGYSRLPSGYSGLQQVTEWLQWVTAGHSLAGCQERVNLGQEYANFSVA